MTAEIIAIGSELTCGAKLDTNSQWLSRELESLGWAVTRHTSLADDLQAMATEFRAAAARSAVVIITGGLGPTLDDITRDALALAFDQPLVMDQDSLQQIQAIFAARGRAMPERNQRQALRPESAQPLLNSCGTAPGILMRIDPANDASGSNGRCLIGVVPGVPAEMKVMFQQQIRPHLMQSGMSVCRSVIRTFGYGESDAERLLGDLTARGRNPEVGITASEAVISLWITARAAHPEESQRMNSEVRTQILERLGAAVYTEDDRELHEVVGDLLLAAQKRLVLLEGSVTGGLMAHWLTEEIRHRPCLAFGHVGTASAASNASSADAKDFHQTARDEASRILQTGAADFVLISSPHECAVSDTGVSLKVGHVAVAARDAFEVHDVSMSGNLAIFRQRAARTALNRLRLLLQNSGSRKDAD
jgi:nicotinamide-nucleotide amidase